MNAGNVVKLVPASKPPAVPKGLSKAAKAEWLRLQPLLTVRGTLTVENTPLLETYCAAMALIQDCDKELAKGKLVIKAGNGVPRPHPLLGARNRAAATALQLAKRLGIIGDGTAPAQPKGGAADGDAYSKLGI
jgi:P27 family predicted phage terminase small subunit